MMISATSRGYGNVCYSHHRGRSRQQIGPSTTNPVPIISFGSPLQRLVLSRSYTSLQLPYDNTSIIACYGDRNSPTIESPAKALRRILDSPGVHQGPACFDALSAKLVERAGFELCFTSGII